jgi:hypothetical protein
VAPRAPVYCSWHFLVGRTRRTTHRVPCARPENKTLAHVREARSVRRYAMVPSGDRASAPTVAAPVRAAQGRVGLAAVAGGAAGGSSGGTGGAGGVAGTAGVGGAAGYGANGLDPLLVPGDPNGEPCEVSVYVNGLGCGYYRACRFVSPTAGACEDVESPCDFYNECADGHACTTNQDCSLMFVCYASACRKFCELDGPCDNGSDCKFIGHESHGVCAP